MVLVTAEGLSGPPNTTLHDISMFENYDYLHYGDSSDEKSMVSVRATKDDRNARDVVVCVNLI